MNTELDLHFGRVTGTGLKSINGNEQCDNKIVYLHEEDARKLYNNCMWGISLKETV